MTQNEGKTFFFSFFPTSDSGRGIRSFANPCAFRKIFFGRCGERLHMHGRMYSGVGGHVNRMVARGGGAGSGACILHFPDKAQEGFYRWLACVRGRNTSEQRNLGALGTFYARFSKRVKKQKKKTRKNFLEDSDSNMQKLFTKKKKNR